MTTWLISTNGLLLTAGNGLPSVGATPPPAATGTAGINILHRSTSQTAPEAITFEVDLTALSGFTASAPAGGIVRDERHHKIEYFWDFYYTGTDNSYLYAAPENLYDGSDAWTNGYRNSRYALGFQAAHVYREPGTYTVRMTAYEPQSGVIAYATQEVTIADPDTTFSGTNTIFLSPSGDFTDAPSGSRQLTSGDVRAAFEAWVDSTTETTPKRIMLNRGETYTNFSLSANACPGFQIVAGPGAGAKPTVNSVSSGDIVSWNDTSGSGKDVVIQNVIFNGTLDTTTTVITTQTSPGGYSCSSATGAPECVLFDGVECYDFARFAEDPRGTYMHLNDCIIEGYGYGASIYKVDMWAMTGTRMMGRVSALTDSTNNQGWGVRFGPSSDQASDCSSIFHSCDMFNHQDWFGSSPHNGQQCIRFNSEGYANGSTNINLHGNCFEARYSALASVEGGGAGGPSAINFVARGNYFMTGYRSISANRWGAGGCTFSSNIFVHNQLADDSVHNTGSVVFINLEDQGLSAADANFDNVIECYQNTLVNHRDGSSAGSDTLGESSGSSLFDITNSNNIIHEPQLPSPNVTYAPLGDDANTYFTSRDAGYLDSVQDLRSTTATVKTAGFTDLYDPETTSSAIGAATTGLVGWRDFRGVIRTDIATTRSRSQSIGAIEPDLAS